MSNNESGTSYYQSAKNYGSSWMPWVENKYLQYFTSDNKASYATKDTLGKSKVTGIDQVDQAQDGVNSLVGDQFGQKGLLKPVGDAFSKEGIDRTEQGGKDASGSYMPSSVSNMAKSAGSYMPSMPGSKK